MGIVARITYLFGYLGVETLGVLAVHFPVAFAALPECSPAMRSCLVLGEAIDSFVTGDTADPVSPVS